MFDFKVEIVNVLRFVIHDDFLHWFNWFLWCHSGLKTSCFDLGKVLLLQQEPSFYGVFVYYTLFAIWTHAVLDVICYLFGRNLDFVNMLGTV